MKKCIIIMSFLFLISCLNSCMFYKDILNFQDGDVLKDGKIDTIPPIQKFTVQKEDILMVTVYSRDNEGSDMFNLVSMSGGGGMMMMMAGGGGGGAVEPFFGYRVDSRGEIDIPIVGKVKVEGKTIEEIQEVVLEKVKATGFLISPNVQIRFMSFRLTVLGEVGMPGTFILPTQQINILQLLGMCGDLSPMSKRDKILIIREKDGVRQYGRLNIKSKDIFQSPFFYLQPNDIIYVEPHRAAIMAAPDPVSRYLGVVVGVISFVTLIVSFRPF